MQIVQELKGLIELQKNKETQERKEEIVEKTLSLIELLNVRLISNDDPFWGNTAILLQKEVSFELEAPAAVYYKESSFFLVINPVLFLEYSVDEMQAIIIHELHHCLLEHLIRGKELFKKHPQSYINIACDVAINQLIKGLPADCLTHKWLCDELDERLEPKREFEYYFDKILEGKGNNNNQDQQSGKGDKNEKEKSEESQKDKNEQDDDSKDESQEHTESSPQESLSEEQVEEEQQEQENSTSDENSDGEQEEQSESQSQGQSEDETDEETESEQEGIGDNSENEENNEQQSDENTSDNQEDFNYPDGFNQNPDTMHDSWKQSESEDDSEQQYQDMIKELIKTASENTPGTMPGFAQSILDKLNEKPEIKWQNVLRKLTGSLPYGKKKTMTRRSRRLPHRLDLRGELSDRLVKIFVACDTSGSMQKQDLERALNEILGITKYIKAEITVIEFDSAIQKIYQIKTKNDIDFTVLGRGGTAVTPVMEYLEEQKEKDSLLVVFTDGGTIERRLKNRPYQRYTLWVLTDKSHRLNIEEPYGEVLYLNY